MGPFFFKNSPPRAFLFMYFYFFFDDPMRFLPVGDRNMSDGLFTGAWAPYQWLNHIRKCFSPSMASQEEILTEGEGLMSFSSLHESLWMGSSLPRSCAGSHSWNGLKSGKAGHIWKPPFYITALFPLPISFLWIQLLPGEGKSYRHTRSTAFLCLILRARLKVSMQKYNTHLKEGKR